MVEVRCICWVEKWPSQTFRLGSKQARLSSKCLLQRLGTAYFLSQASRSWCTSYTSDCCRRFIRVGTKLMGPDYLFTGLVLGLWLRFHTDLFRNSTRLCLSEIKRWLDLFLRQRRNCLKLPLYCATFGSTAPAHRRLKDRRCPYGWLPKSCQ
jgi:hypothetical protein